MRTFMVGTLAAVTLSLCVSSNASADWRYRNRARFDHGRRVVVSERYWAAPVQAVPVYSESCYFGTGWGPSYRTYYHRHYHPYHHHQHHHGHHRR